MFASSNSWSVPAHLYMVSGWSAKCSSKDPTSCVNEGDAPDTPELAGAYACPSRRRPRGLPRVRGPDLRVDRHHVPAAQVRRVVGVLRRRGPRARLRRGHRQITCKPGEQNAATVDIWNPLPYFQTVKDNDQLKNIQSIEHFDAAAKDGHAAGGVLGDPERQVSEHPPSTVMPRSGVRDGMVNAIMNGSRLELDRHLRRRGTTGAASTTTSPRPRSTRTATASACPGS